jgi:hypothetical protein
MMPSRKASSGKGDYSSKVKRSNVTLPERRDNLR